MNIAAYFPHSITFVAIHIVVGLFVISQRVLPRLRIDEIADNSNIGVAQLLGMFEIYANLLAADGTRSWDYYYARIFKFFHIAALIVIVAHIADTLLRNGSGAV